MADTQVNKVESGRPVSDSSAPSTPPPGGQGAAAARAAGPVDRPSQNHESASDGLVLSRDVNASSPIADVQPLVAASADPQTNEPPQRSTDPADFMGLHLLTAYPENGSAAQQQGWQGASGAGALTDAASLKGLSNASSPEEMRRRDQLIATMKWSEQNGYKTNIRLDYEWGENVPVTAQGRAEYAQMTADFMAEARRQGVDVEHVNFILGNEPNLKTAPGGRMTTAEEYVAAVQAVRQELNRRGLSKVQLGGPALSPGGQGDGQEQAYFGRLMQLGLGQSVDFYAMHEYEDSLKNISSLNDIARQHGQDKPIIISEFGVPRAGGRDANGQATATADFARQVAAWNADPAHPPIESVTLWCINRGEGDLYTMTPELMKSVQDLTHGRYSTGAQADLGPVSAGGGGGTVQGGGGSAPIDSPVPLSNLEQTIDGLSNWVLAGRSAGMDVAVPRQQLAVLADTVEQGQIPLQPVTRNKMLRALDRLQLSGDLKQGNSSGGGGTPSPDSSPVGTAAPTASAPLPPADPNADYQVRYIRNTDDPNSPSGGPGLEIRVFDAQGNPLDSNGMVVQYNAGGENYYARTENKNEPGKGSNYVYIPLFPKGTDHFNVTLGRMEGDKFVPSSPPAGVEVDRGFARGHQIGEVRFQQSDKKAVAKTVKANPGPVKGS